MNQVILTQIGKVKISDRTSRGFSLVELLMVICVVTLLAVVSIPALSGLSSGGKMTQTVIELSGLLEQARQYAIAQNTYVWVAFRVDATQADGDSLTVAILASKDGTDPSPWMDYGAVPNTSIDLIGRVRTFRQVKLSDAGAFTTQNVATLPANPTVDATNSMSNNTAQFKIKTPGSSNAVSFNRVLQFSPSGQVKNSENPINLVEFGLQPLKQTAKDMHNLAVIRVSGITGQTLVYRP